MIDSSYQLVTNQEEECFYSYYHKLQKRGVEFVRPPKSNNYGMAAVFTDLYGNLWDLIEPSSYNKGLLESIDSST